VACSLTQFSLQYNFLLNFAYNDQLLLSLSQISLPPSGLIFSIQFYFLHLHGCLYVELQRTCPPQRGLTATLSLCSDPIICRNVGLFQHLLHKFRGYVFTMRIRYDLPVFTSSHIAMFSSTEWTLKSQVYKFPYYIIS